MASSIKPAPNRNKKEKEKKKKKKKKIVTPRELWNMTEGNRVAYDFIGWILSKLEWGLVYIIAKDGNGLVSKEAFRRVFDGSLFEYLAKKQKGFEK